MRFDIVLSVAQRPGIGQRETFAAATQSAQWAEELGYSGIWLLEHHFTNYSLCTNALNMASFLLGGTERIRVGSAITIVPLEHPIKLAERVAMLDHLSGGRFDFGIGRGTYARDFEAFAVDMTVNHLALVETMDQVVRAWGEEPYVISSMDGTLDAVPVQPKPLTHPHPPVYVASGSPDTVRWAAAHGYPLLIREAMPDNEKRALMSRYRETAGPHGQLDAAARHALTCIAVLDDTNDRAADTVREHVGWWVAEGATSNGLLARRHLLPNYRTYFDAVDAGRKAGGRDASGVVEKMIPLNLVGTPQRCRDRLTELYESTGLTHFILAFDANPPGEPTYRAMQRCMDEVLRPVAAACEGTLVP
ncbi:LLM class flavin-dependent oxidoreductase [Nocardia brasiliensis]|uniref:bacterial luciferase n=1 Tax=Nocardia brasiliensis (strain ATCC 700358 / HUJEG-1) TaxID=1133849 RepID=K0F3X8_NOCB7|nr:LLM class flavin-dependent oxidoreductase [Nocardia brasiliensis]AFU02271.1 luciferase [Nocardia brasiliensis ATCC 700358]